MYFDKPHVAPNDILEIAKTYDLGSVVNVEYLGGVPNVTYKVIAEKKCLALRVGNRGYTSSTHLELEVKILDHLEKVGFAESPRVIRTATGKKIHYWQGYPILATDYIDGITADNVQVNRSLCFDIGRVVASLQHSLISFRTEVPASETFLSRISQMVGAFPDSVKKLGWKVDTSKVLSQWKEAEISYLHLTKSMTHNVVHTDIWPPNVILIDNQVKGVVDFDDWAYGPTVIDICAPLVEFPMENDTNMNPDFAISILLGFLRNGGPLEILKEDILACSMELLCISWLSCNAIHQVSFMESTPYIHKLEFLRDKYKRKNFEFDLKQLIRAAKGSEGHK